jgi:hypothetical protein
MVDLQRMLNDAEYNQEFRDAHAISIALKQLKDDVVKVRSSSSACRRS